jgi:hypothetical protein
VEFRENAIKVALKAFGTPNFLSWLVTNYSTGLTTVQSAFLIDTVKYLYNLDKKPRNIDIFTWRSLIEPAATGPIKLLPKEIMDVFEFVKDHSVMTAVINWCEHENGILDLVNTLDILFGSAEDLNPHAERPKPNTLGLD